VAEAPPAAIVLQPVLLAESVVLTFLELAQQDKDLMAAMGPLAFLLIAAETVALVAVPVLVA